MAIFQRLKSRISDWFDTSSRSGAIIKGVIALVVVVLVVIGCVGFYWDSEPPLFDVRANAKTLTEQLGVREVTGSTVVATEIGIADTLLHKRGGYLTNDIMPPGAWMDNIPNWEFGVLVQLRDMARTLRNNLSRSQSQSAEDPDLVTAENQFYFDNDSWALPDTEGEYAKGIRALKDYLKRLGDTNDEDAQFYARADNLNVWLSEVDTRLGSLSQRLSACVGKEQLNTSLAGDTAATQSTPTSPVNIVKTPWTQLDDVFYQARGSTWALILLLKAVEVDFHGVLEKKNAVVSMEQIIRELEPTQDPVWSPVILNGSGFGLVANHSLVMASHISRANAALIDLRRLLSEG